MLVFFVLLVLVVILYFFIKRFSGVNITETLDFINLSNPDSAIVDIIDDPMAQEIIITNSKYAFYKKEIKRTDFIKILNTIAEKNPYNLSISLDKFEDVKSVVNPITHGYFKKFLLDQMSILVHEYDQKYGYHHIWFEQQTDKLKVYKNYRDTQNN